MNERDVLLALPGLLAGLGADGEWEDDPRGDSRADGRISVTVPGVGTRSYVVEVRSRLTPSSATAVRQGGDEPLMLVAPHVSDGVGAILREISVDYVDMAGNGSIRWPGVHIDVRGRRAVASASTGSGRGSKAFTRAGLQVLFVLLTEPTAADATLRQLAELSGTSLGTVQGVVGHLGETGAVVQTPSGRRLHRPGRLLDRWVEGYATRLAPSLHIRSFRAEHSDWWAAAREDDPDLLVGGEAAAAALDPMLRPASVTFYVTGTPTQLVRRHRLVPASAQEGNVHVRRRFWADEGIVTREGLVPTTLVYADLVTSGEPRLLEHAERLRRTDARLVELDRS